MAHGLTELARSDEARAQSQSITKYLLMLMSLNMETKLLHQRDKPRLILSRESASRHTQKEY